MVMDFRPEQSLKAFMSMLVTELGMLIEVRPELLSKAEAPMLVTEYVFPP